MPDPLGWVDLAATPEQLYERITDRIRAGRYATRASQFPLRKGEGKYRQMAVLNPLDELALRSIVGRTAHAADRAVNREIVFSGGLDGRGSNWRTRPHKKGFKARQARAMELLQAHDCVALGTLDVSDFFGSVRGPDLLEALHQAGAPLGAAELAADSFDTLTASGAPPGLPIGFEGSAVYGNVMLVEVDDLFWDRDVPCIRWSDDIWVFLSRDSDWETLTIEAASRLARRHLRLNGEKVRCHDKIFDNPRGVIVESAIDYMIGDAGGLAPIGEVVSLLEEQADLGENASPSAVSFAFGSLNHQVSGAGLPLLYDYPLLFALAPRKAGDYLETLLNSRQTRGTVDQDWLVERVCERPNLDNVVCKLHAARAAGSGPRLSEAAGERLFEGATSGIANLDSPAGPMTLSPARSWMAKPWTRSSHFSPDRAIEAAEAIDDLNIRRVMTSGLASQRDSKASGQWVQKLRNVDPDLEPTLTFVLGRAA